MAVGVSTLLSKKTTTKPSAAGKSGTAAARGFYYAVLAAAAVWLLLFFLHPIDLRQQIKTPTAAPPYAVDQCMDRYIYVHDLPSKFNDDMLRDCDRLSQWTDMCVFLSSAGLGPPLPMPDDDDVFSGEGNDTGGWFATNQFALDVIFHNRMKQYECLTMNSSAASAIYVPFYAGLDVSRYLWGYNTSVRDSTAVELIIWLSSKPEWKKMNGKDHFFVAGRTTWDFRRLSDEQTDWGSKLLLLSEIKNMTALVIEASPWHNNDVAVPYPTYFHPRSTIEVSTWQQKMRTNQRPWLFSFVGAARPNQSTSIREIIINQCKKSRHCELLDCSSTDGELNRCHSPSSVMSTFQKSTFCLQPQGDSYTRRSAFDAMIAGCIPVFFHPGSFYVQYTWHLPKNYSSYSVFIGEDEVRDGRVGIEQVLKKYSEDEVREMRERVIRLIPPLIYADPRSRLDGLKDAFDVAVEGVIERVRRFKEEIMVRDYSMEVEENSWKNVLGWRGGQHIWDHFFSR